MLNKLIMLFTVLIFTLVVSIVVYADNFLSNASYNVCFSPHGKCTDKIITAINNANKQILIQAYSFTSAPIAEAILMAKRRNVDIGILLDKGQATAKYSAMTFFNSNGINTNIDYKPAIAHNKVMIIDGETVITGSFNFTKAAEEKNTENIIIIKDANLAKKYIVNYQNRAMLSTKNL